MKKITIYLHVGMVKTGTSALQNFLDINRFTLFSKHKCLYPNLRSYLYFTGRYHTHCDLNSCMKTDQKKAVNTLVKMVKFAQALRMEKIVLSCESWLGQKFAREAFKTLKEMNCGIDVKVICYIRRIDSWFESSWKQWGLKKFDNYVDYYEQYKFRYKRVLDDLYAWSDIVGKENVIVHAYEKQQLPKGIQPDFLNLLDIDYQSNDWKKTETTNLAQNYGFNRDVLEILGLCKGLYDGMNDNKIFDLFASLLGESFQKKPYESYDLISSVERLELIKNNRPFESEIARVFMNREDGRVFYDPLPDPDDPQVTYPGLTMEIAMPIIVKMISEVNRRTQGNNLWLKIKRSNGFRSLVNLFRPS